MSYFWLVLCCLSLTYNLISGQNVHYNCTNDPWKCVFKDFASVEDLDEFGVNLEYLNYYHNYYGEVYQEWRSSFRTIELQNGSITHLPLKFIEKFSNILSFNANGLGIEEIDKHEFESMRFLINLHLSRNKIKSLQKSLFRYLERVIEIDLSHNLIEVVQPDVFKNINENIEGINLSNNHIKEINEIFLTYFPQGQLQADDNYLILNLEHNQIERFIPANESCILEKKINFNINNNNLTSLVSQCALNELYLKNNQLRSIDANSSLIYADQNEIETVKITNRAKHLSLSSNNVKNITCNDNKVDFLDLSSNNLQLLDNYVEMLSNFNEIRELDISNNPFVSLKIGTFAKMKNLEKLSISKAGMIDISYGLFEDLKRLERLDISYNQLKTIDFHKFYSLENLNFLNLGANYLHSIDEYENIKTILHSLRQAAIEDNKWECQYLMKMKNSFKRNEIEVIEAQNSVEHESHIDGISCLEKSENTSRNVLEETAPISKLNDSSNKISSSKVIEKIDQINANMSKTARENQAKLDRIAAAADDKKQNRMSISEIFIMGLLLTMTILIGFIAYQAKIYVDRKTLQRPKSTGSELKSLSVVSFENQKTLETVDFLCNYD